MAQAGEQGAPRSDQLAAQQAASALLRALKAHPENVW